MELSNESEKRRQARTQVVFLKENLLTGLMMIRPGLDSVVAVVVRGASLGIPAIFKIPHRPTAPTIHLPLLHPLLLLSLPLLHPLLLLRVLRE
ncbi:unnamed protein product [Brassica oleracea var. botrytis]